MSTVDVGSRRELRKPALWLWVTLSLLALGLLIFGFIRSLPAFLHDPKPIDFAAYFAAASLLNAGNPQQLYDLVAQNAVVRQYGLADAGGGYIYPPFFAVLLRPLALLPFQQAVLVWLFANLVLLLTSVAILLRIANWDGGRWHGLLFFGGALLVPPVTSSLIFGQVNVLVLVLLAGAVHLLDRRKFAGRGEAWAGVLIGLGGAVKVYPLALCLPLAIHRRYRALLSCMAALVITAVVGVSGAGGIGNTLVYWLRVLPGYSGSDPALAAWQPANQSLLAAARRLVVTTEYRFSVFDAGNYASVQTQPLIAGPNVVAEAALLVAIGLCVVSLVVMGRARGKDALPLSLALMLVTVLVTLPVVWDYYLCLLLIPGAVLLSSGNRATSIKIMLVVLTLLVLQRYYNVMAYAGVPVWALSFGLLATLTTWLYLLRAVATSPPAEGGPTRRSFCTT